MSTTGKRIRSLRAERDLTLKELASKAGISLGYLGDIERGRTNPSLETLNAIATALSIDPQVLIASDEQGILVTNDSLKAILRGAQELGEEELRELHEFIEFKRLKRRHQHTEK